MSAGSDPNPRSMWAPGTTHWSVLLAPSSSSDAWQFFYERYRDSVTALFRRSGVREAELEDLVQEFFAASLQREFLAKADPKRGRFRGYLCTAARRFLASHYRKSGRLKRMPEAGVVALDSAIAATVKDGRRTPESEFDLAWARAVLGRAVARAEQDYQSKGKADHAETFRLRQAGLGWQAVVERLGTTQGAVRGWVSRFEQRVAEYLREEVAGTVASEVDLEAELRALSEILSES